MGHHCSTDISSIHTAMANYMKLAPHRVGGAGKGCRFEDFASARKDAASANEDAASDIYAASADKDAALSMNIDTLTVLRTESDAIADMAYLFKPACMLSILILRCCHWQNESL